ncbi:acyltransferase family protein [Burkholderia plantarii]|uniref:acyltransferase family protein n=1 Tax=Burkholderia plantarii TaxID=41899 RepID=UPI0018DD3EAA|nr:acyltransferase family protein [Burkholderia plantarii]MBI0328406.1 acyltransferase [Burkholderia plantarii]
MTESTSVATTTRDARPPTAASHAAAGYRPDIDVLRALAVLSVVVFHALPAMLPGGFVGVDVFFVISGYLITSHLLRDLGESRFSLAAFYGRRIRRLFPALLVVLAGVYLFGWFNLLPDEFKSLGKHIAGGATSVANLVLWSEAGYFDASADHKPLLHLWSLGVEEQFYLAWPLLLWVASRARRGPLWAVLGLGTLSFAANLAIVGHAPTAAFYWPVTRAWELMIGSLLACREARSPQPAPRHPELGALAGLALLLGSMALMNARLTFPGAWALAPTLGAALLIHHGRASRLMARLATRPVLLVGLISYPLYLIHWPILSFLRLMSIGVPAWYLRVAGALAAVPLAWLVYRCVERPARRSRRPRLVTGLLLVLVLAIGYLGYNTYRRDGLAFRMSRLTERFAGGAHFDLDHDWRRGTCYLEGADQERFASSCVEPGSAPLVFLWGDSRAAAIYPGFVAQQGRFGVRLGEFSASGCPPLLGGNDHCGRIAAAALDALRAARPHTLVLTANWDAERLAALDRTVAAARAAGVQRIVLLGQVATWQSSLPTLYWVYWRAHHAELPERSDFGIDPAARRYDLLGAATARRLGIDYVSAYDAMCNAAGCVTRSGDGRGRIVSFDGSHLTPDGARDVMSRIAPQLLH